MCTFKKHGRVELSAGNAAVVPPVAPLVLDGSHIRREVAGALKPVSRACCLSVDSPYSSSMLQVTLGESGLAAVSRLHIGSSALLFSLLSIFNPVAYFNNCRCSLFMFPSLVFLFPSTPIFRSPLYNISALSLSSPWDIAVDPVTVEYDPNSALFCDDSAFNLAICSRHALFIADRCCCACGMAVEEGERKDNPVLSALATACGSPRPSCAS